MKLKDKQAIDRWEKLKKQLAKATFIDMSETEIQKRKRVQKLEDDYAAWIKYYFPSYAKYEPAPFHLKKAKQWIDNTKVYQVNALARELGKSTTAMFEDLYLMLTGKAKFKIQVSSSWDKACALLEPYMLNLESNQRIINDYGEQKKLGSWETGFFITKAGFGFVAIGAGQSPRGLRIEEVRPDILDIDDIDTDEDCRNPKIIRQKWEWLEQALIPTLSVSGNKRIRFNGNIIAKYCCITEAIKKADFVNIVNIRDAQGKSTWKAKNNEPDIDYMLSKISYISAQKEYFNNPITEGSVFKEMHYKQLRSLQEYKFLVCYNDLSYKSSTKNDYKAAVLMGKWKDEYHIIKCWVKQGTTREMAMGLVDINNYVGGKVPIYFYAEDNFLQDIFIKELHGHLTDLGAGFYINSDTRKKPDKFYRIESTLEPLNSNGKLFLNDAEKNNPHMQVLEDQFRALEAGSKANDDAPDAAEGAKHMIDTKIFAATPIYIGKRKPSKHRV